MSSHHIIREDQEPALFILGEISFSKIEPLLEWSPLLLVADTVLATVISWGVKIDMVVAQDTKCEEIRERLKHQTPLKILPYDTNNLLENALNFLIGRQQKAVHVAGPVSADLQKFLMEFPHRIQITLIEESLRWLLISQGNFKKWMPQGIALTIIKKRPCQDIKISGIDFLAGTGVTEKEGFVIIESTEAYWIGESLE